MSRARLPLALAVSIVALLLSACTNGDDSTPIPTASVPPAGSETIETPEPTAEPTAEATAASAGTAAPTAAPTDAPTAAPVTPSNPQPVAVLPALGGRGFDQPIEIGAYPGGRFFVAEQDGAVFLFDADGSNERTLLDIRDRVSRGGGEEGLLSVALDPAFSATGQLWVYYSAANPRRSELSRFTIGGDVADPGSELVVLKLEQPFSNHNGGAIRFGPDGMLYLGLGDGGSGDDPLGSGQDRSTLLGSIIRIDVRDASVAQPYAIPEDNPFVDEAGARPEIWAYGLRNPWRMAFDPSTGALWVGDVGQDQVEEITIVGRGENHGWDIVEGDICHEPSSGCPTAGLTPPVATYGHGGGRCSVTGGVVYRGNTVPEISGSYLYADFCSGEIWALPLDGSSPPVIVVDGLGFVSSFGTDVDGEVYVLRFGDSILRLASP